jgi:hypothetical protein
LPEAYLSNRRATSEWAATTINEFDEAAIQWMGFDINQAFLET